MPLSLGPFNLEDILGAGGMGAVWRGRHPPSGEAIAVKVLTRDHARSPRYQEAFGQEARAIAGLRHPHVCEVLDFGTVSADAAAASGGQLVEGSPWLAMELAQGSLRGAEGALPWAALRRALLEVLDGLAHAHARGVIHRDIKPDNLLRTARGVALADFGIAHLEREDTPVEARSAGTPAYMAPEQLLGQWRELGPWTDLFALGRTAWALACGAPPCDAGALLQLQISHTLPPPAPLRPAVAVPEALEGWLRALMAGPPGERFQSAAAAARALAAMGPATRAPTRTAAPAAPADTLDWETGERTGTATAATPPLQTLQFLVEAPAAPAARSLPPAPPREAPPLPADWRRPRPPSRRLSGVGLGLYGLRSVPLVGREATRDALWAALARVCGGRGAQAVALTGEAGVGKSRLVDWLRRRALECGAADCLAATYSAPATASDGLLAALSRHLRLRDLDRPQVAARLERLLRPEAPEQLGALTELLRPLRRGEDPQGVPAVALKTLEQRQAALLTALQRLCVDRPLLVWLDDVQWSEGGLEVVGELLERDPSPPILVLLTAREEALADAPVQAAALAALAGHPRVQRLAVAPLDGERRVALVEELLGLSGPLAEQVAERTGGNPLFATQLVGDWVSRGVLVVRGGAFVVAEGAAVDIPDAIHDLWARRLDRVLRGLPAEAGFALEIAAQLGARVDEGEWREACEQAKLQPPTALVERLLQQGLARDIERGWAFVHGMLSESITRIAGEQRRLEDARGAAGAALAERGADRWRREELRAAEDLLSRADRALRAEAHGALWAGRVRPLLSAARWKLGQPEAAVAGLEEALERAMALELVGAEALLLNNLGNIHRLQGRFQQALGCYQRCRSLAAAAGDRRLEIGVLSGLGSLYSRTLEHQQALNCYQEMLALAEGLGDSRLLRLALSGLGTTLGDSGDHRRALECFERELALFTPDDGHLAPAVVLGNLGTACLELGRLAEARGHLERSLALHREATNTRSVGVTLRNLGQLCLAEGAPEEARDLLLKALASSEALGLQRDQARDHHHLGRAALALGEPAMARLHITRAVELYTAIELPECAAESRALLA